MWKKLAVKPSVPSLFLVEEFLPDIIFICSFSFSSNFGKLWAKNCPLLLDIQICWHEFVYSSPECFILCLLYQLCYFFPTIVIPKSPSFFVSYVSFSAFFFFTLSKHQHFASGLSTSFITLLSMLTFIVSFLLQTFRLSRVFKALGIHWYII